MSVLRVLDCFSGIGGFTLAADRLGGFETTQFVELDPFCSKVLQKQWPEVPIHGDIRTFTGNVGQFDVITAGFPCQDLSSAGKQAGLGGERSGLFYEVIRLARELQPRFIVFENVANLVSHKDGETFQEVLFQIARAGFDAEWAVVSARDVGACHLRKRVWIVAYAQSTGAWQHEPYSRGQCDGKSLLGDRGADQKIPLASDTQSRRWGTGTGQSESSAGYQRTGVSNCGAGSDVAYTKGKSGDDMRLEDAGQAPESELGDSDRADAADADDAGLQGREPAGVCEYAAEWTAWQGNPPSCGLSADWRSYVSEPVLCRGDDGLSGRVDRLKALGNAVVPQAAMVPLRRVLQLANHG